MNSLEIMEPSACTWCGIAQRGHGRQYADAVGYHAWSAPSKEQILARMKARRLAAAVAKQGALPMPVGPEPQALSSEQRAQIAELIGAAKPATDQLLFEMAQQIRDRREHDHSTAADWDWYCLNASGWLGDKAPTVLRRLLNAEARVAELEAERKKYVGREPTVAEEMAYLSRCIDSVLDLCDKAEEQAKRWENPLPVPGWVAKVREAADGLVERRSYPPALPWARLMDDEDLREFLGDLGAAVLDYYRSEPSVPDRDVLASIEKACADWRLIAEAQHGHNAAPGPDAPEMRSLREALTGSPDRPGREPEGEFHNALHHTYRVGHDLPETGGEGA